MIGLPAWAPELGTLLPACAHFLVSGNVRDLYLVEPAAVGHEDAPVDHFLLPFADVVGAVLARRGITALVDYDITTGARAITRDGAGDGEGGGPSRVDGMLRAGLGRSLDDLSPETLSDLAELVEAVSHADEPVGLLVRSASRLAQVAQLPEDREFEFFRQVDRMARTAQPGPNGLFNPVVWMLDREQDVPAWFMVGNEKLRSLALPLPDTGERERAARVFVGRMREEAPPAGTAADARTGVTGEAADAGDPARTLAEHTAGLSLVAMESIVSIAQDQGMGRDQLEDAARAYRVGVVDNPWRHSYLSDRLRNELGRLQEVIDAPADAPPDPPRDPKDRGLVHRVLGQEAAVRKALDILVRSVVNMTGAHSRSGTGPRGVLFLAGPTGVGKTELAKGMTKLVFDDERLCIRFDMSEFSAEHASERLIGAPPGYIGYERGGELTNAVRQQPFSVVLFDEIEKADPRVLDKFLQLLDDGRLTDGRGETAYFTESIIVFTSNLGIYKDVMTEDEDGGRRVERKANVTPASDPEVVELRVKEAIFQHFNLRLGRPELLNRIGPDNIVVFDFIRRPTGMRILRGMLGNVVDRVRDEHHVDLVLGPYAEATITDECLRDEVLAMGGRGIRSQLETVLINPLAREVFLRRAVIGGAAELTRLVKENGAWTARLEPLASPLPAAPGSPPDGSPPDGPPARGATGRDGAVPVAP